MFRVTGLKSLGKVGTHILFNYKMPFKMHEIIFFPENVKKILGVTSQFRSGRVRGRVTLNTGILLFGLSEQGRLWQDCASVQACLCLIAAHLFDKYQSLKFLLHCYPILFQYRPEESPPRYLEVRSLHCPTCWVPWLLGLVGTVSLILALLLSYSVSVQTRGVSSKISGSKKSALPYLLGSLAVGAGGYCVLFLLYCYPVPFQYRAEESPQSYQEVRSLHCLTCWVPWLLGLVDTESTSTEAMG